ncbi:Regulator of nonsense transcripts 1-like protein [Lasiodiplodia theobromae]|uniref:Regulator of nonsense transcripts 1-like protein n=1 Tax=Lasiodiplodia theobromae TaxID=45133 RepID=A0A5N5D0S6_9PEZI|nr:Regulator of nonsense transcripts 1-like protein [Lasiodiplodia theobromae]
MDKEQRANFTGTITELRKHVFEIMDVIVTTASNAGDAKPYEWVQPSMIFIYEAAQVPEPDSWSLFVFYAVDTPKILVGDMAQLKPPAHYENRFRQQFSLSLMGRFAMIGYPLVMLNEQHRMHSSIYKVVSTTFYDGKIRTAPGTDDNPLSQTFREYMQEYFKLPRNAALLNCVESVAECDAHSSVFNNTHVRLVGHLVRGLMERGVEPSSIAILTPYNARFFQYSRALTGLQAMYPLADMREIALGKIDAYQGRQADIVIVDLPNHDSMGFLDDPTRLNVGLSRAKRGLVVVANTSVVTKKRFYAKSCLARVLSFLKRAGSSKQLTNKDLEELRLTHYCRQHVGRVQKAFPCKVLPRTRVLFPQEDLLFQLRGRRC